MPKMLLFVIVLLVVAATALSLHASAKAPKPLDLTQVAEAIRQVEFWDGHSVGAANERGPWQMTRATWFTYSGKPFWWASSAKREHKEEQHRVALAHVHWISDNLVNIPLKPSAYSIGLVYTAGWSGTKHGKPSKAKRDYAQRVQNIYDELTGR